MAYILQNRIELSIFIDDKEYPLEDTNQLNFLHISQVATTFFPTFCFQIVDNSRIMDIIGLQDGIPVRIVIKQGENRNQIFNFRMRHALKQTGNPIPTYTIDGYYDSPRWYSGTTNRNIRGTANEVLAEIASQCGLQYDGVATNDSMLWTPQNSRWRQFAKDVTMNAYVNPTSCMCSVLDLDGVLRLRDIHNLTEDRINIVAFQNQDNAVTSVSNESIAQSGFNNAISGYWNARVVQSSTGDATHDRVDQLQFKADSRSPLFNTAVKDDARAGMVRFSPIDVGNLHPNYERASYQNNRYRNLFSLGQQLLINQPTQFRIFNPVTFSVQKEDQSQDISASGNYTVSGRAILIQGTNYGEKLVIVRHGTNENYVEG